MNSACAWVSGRAGKMKSLGSRVRERPWKPPDMGPGRTSVLLSAEPSL